MLLQFYFEDGLAFSDWGIDGCNATLGRWFFSCGSCSTAITYSPYGPTPRTRVVETDRKCYLWCFWEQIFAGSGQKLVNLSNYYPKKCASEREILLLDRRMCLCVCHWLFVCLWLCFCDCVLVCDCLYCVCLPRGVEKCMYCNKCNNMQYLVALSE